MGSGIRALMEEATEAPLSFEISMYCGQMIVTGTVAPSGWWYEVTCKVARAQIIQAHRRVRADVERHSLINNEFRPIEGALLAAHRADPAPPDELTLIDVHVVPAFSAPGTTSVGQRLPVARIALASIDLWWIVSGDEVNGRADSETSFGVLFPALGVAAH